MYEDESFSTVFVESKPRVNKGEKGELDFPLLGQTQWDEILLVVGWTVQVDINGLLQPTLWKLVIHYFPIVHNAFCLPLKFCINYCCEILLGGLHITKSIPQH